MRRHLRRRTSRISPCATEQRHTGGQGFATYEKSLRVSRPLDDRGRDRDRDVRLKMVQINPATILKCATALDESHSYKNITRQYKFFQKRSRLQK